MFWLIVLMLAMGGPRMIDRPVSFPTFEACEAAREVATPSVRARIAQVEVIAYCVSFENET